MHARLVNAMRYLVHLNDFDFISSKVVHLIPSLKFRRLLIFYTHYIYFLYQGPVPVAVPQPEPHSVGGVLVHMPHVCSVCISRVLDKYYIPIYYLLWLTLFTHCEEYFQLKHSTNNRSNQYDYTITKHYALSRYLITTPQ